MRLACEGAACGYGGRTVVSGITWSLGPGEALCVLGPNGVGKTTLFRTILGFQPLRAGAILLDGRDIRRWAPRELARAIAYVPQAHTPPFPFRVSDVVLMGRNPHLGPFAAPGARDRRIAAESLERLGIASLADRPYTEISGGERQLVLVARALAQEAQVLILDEPTASLDFGNQVRVLERIRALVGDGLAVLMTTHAPDHAFLCATQVVLLAPGRAPRVGTPSAVLTEESLREAYGVEVRLVHPPPRTGYAGSPACVPLLRQGTEPGASG